MRRPSIRHRCGNVHRAARQWSSAVVARCTLTQLCHRHRAGARIVLRPNILRAEGYREQSPPPPPGRFRRKPDALLKVIRRDTSHRIAPAKSARITAVQASRVATTPRNRVRRARCLSSGRYRTDRRAQHRGHAPSRPIGLARGESGTDGFVALDGTRHRPRRRSRSSGSERLTRRLRWWAHWRSGGPQQSAHRIQHVRRGRFDLKHTR